MLDKQQIKQLFADQTDHIESVEWVISLLYSLVLCLAITIVDVEVIRTFQGLETDTQIFKWHMILYPIEFFAPIFLAYIQKRIVPLSCWIYFIAGLEDTVFYLLQFGRLPTKYFGIRLFGIFLEPPLNIVLTINFLGIVLMLTYFAILGRISKERNQ